MNQLPVNPIDLAIVIVMLLSAIFSWVRGFTGEVLAVASWVAAAIAAYFLHPWALTYIAPSIANKQLALAAAIAAVAQPKQPNLYYQRLLVNYQVRKHSYKVQHNKQEHL